MNIDIKDLSTPTFLVDERLLEKNLKVLQRVIEQTGCKILLAQKGFSMFSMYPMIHKYLHGTTASGIYEAKLGFEEMGGETHIYSPAYIPSDFKEIVKICDHIVFNSFRQWEKFRDEVKNVKREISCGIRINPEYAEVETEIYNPCAVGSRLGVTIDRFEPDLLEGIDGLHFHTMCEQNADVLERTLKVVEEKFGRYLAQMKWLNFGGGHHITRADYDLEKLIACITYIKEKYDVQVYLEPGEAIALQTGYMIASVLDIVENGMTIAILDTSAACHMPDVLEMPYRPEVIGAGKKGEKPYTYRFGGPTCLAGDIIGDYSFDQPLQIGDKVVFTDMAHYTMVKTNTFNGMKLPNIASYHEKDGIRIIKEFGYEDFKMRLS